jgi:DNA-binding NtrC family response regulator
VFLKVRAFSARRFKVEILHIQIERTLKKQLMEWMPTSELEKILLIDGNKESALSAALSREGYHVIHCDSVQKAWSFIYPYPPHLIIVHIDDLHRTGLVDLEECWVLAEGVPIILATSARVNQTVMEAVQHRAAAILVLPPMLKTNGEALGDPVVATRR